LALQIIEGWGDLGDDARGAAIAFGEFDGVHLGHRSVIALAAKAARELDAPLGVISFEPPSPSRSPPATSRPAPWKRWARTFSTSSPSTSRWPS
jgi:FAD synthase